MRAIVRLAALAAAGFAVHVSTVEAAGEKVVHAFCVAQSDCSDGAQPMGGLINVDGTLYGTTSSGGVAGLGTVFSFDPASGTESVLWSFSRSDHGLFPAAGVISFRNIFYGTTRYGGANSGGTVFTFDPAADTETAIHSFGGANDGNDPEAGLIAAGGKLYGTTVYGGTGNCSDGCGTVYAINPKTGREDVLHSFQKDGTDGHSPYAALLNVGGTLYGTTLGGGSGNCACGTVFSIDPMTGAETVLHAFQDEPDGSTPFAGLTNVNGTLYGMTEAGGAYGNGTIFSLNPVTGEETAVYSFLPGSEAISNLIKVGSTLYGTTYFGGSGSSGEVFAFEPATATMTVLYSFCPDGYRHCKDAKAPWGPLAAVNGTLYGTSYAGGSRENTECIPRRAGCGTVFAVKLH